MLPSEFLRLLWGPSPPGQVLVWRLPSKHSTWFQSFNNLDAFCAAHLDEEVYTGVSIVRNDARVTGATRTSNINAAGIAGLSIDLDIADPVHKKTALPKSAEEALSIIQAPPPTVLVHSGHGLQAWWLFEGGPWIFRDTPERIQAQRLMQWWSDRLKERAATQGWAWDATFDLARVMRLPGTMNNKAEPVHVDVYFPLGPRIGLAALLKDLPGIKIRAMPTATVNGHHLVLNAEAVPPVVKFDALMAASMKFDRSWEHERKDLKDQTPSSYDMSLAIIAAQADWTDQEIADLLIAHRRKHGVDLKLREDYYQRTINRARGPKEATEAVEQLDHSEDAASALEVISQLLGVQIEQMLRYDTNPVTFGVLISGRDVRLGEAEGINSQTKFRNKIAGATLVNIHLIDKDAWGVVSQKLLSVCETVDLGEETRPADELWHLLLDYLQEHRPEADLSEAIRSKRPMILENERIAINLPAFIDYLVGALHRNFKRPDVTIWLRNLGAEPKRILAPNYGQAYVWALPASIKAKNEVAMNK